MLLMQHYIPAFNGYFEVHTEKPDLGCSVKQVHGAEVADLNNLSPMHHTCEADGIYWTADHSWKTFPLIQTADCLPILALGHGGGALLHAGWRGIQKKIFLNEAIKKINPTYFFLGPSIQAESFIVTEEFLAHFPHSPHFKINAEKITFNLQAETIDTLRQHFPSSIIEDCNIDTYVDLKFASYRRSRGHQARNWNLYRPAQTVNTINYRRNI